MEIEPGDLRRIYRLSLESTRGPMFARGLQTEAKFEAHLNEIKRLETDEDAVVVKFSDIWVIASR